MKKIVISASLAILIFNANLYATQEATQAVKERENTLLEI